MGISSSTSKTEPWKQAQAPILAANSAVAGTYNQNAPKIQGYADSIGGLIPGMLDKFKAGNPGVNAANDWITRTLGQQGGNPNLQGMIDQSGQDVGRGVSASMGVRGLTGGSVHEQILAHELGKNAMGLRYNDYNNQQQLQAQAAGMAPGNAAADYLSISPLLGAAGAASGLPMDAASQYAGATGGLLGQYTTTKQSQPWGSALLGAAANGLGSFAAGGGKFKFSDQRLKEDIRTVGKTDAGLPVYTYRYKGDQTVHMGVMAQDVAQMQPDALGPVVSGYMTVRYGEVR